MKRLFSLFVSLLFVTYYYGCTKDKIPSCNKYSNIFTVDSVKIKKNVLIIGIDGFRSDAMQLSISPFMHNLSSDNNVYYNPSHATEGDTYSGPNWSSILTGVHYNKHNVIDNSFVGNRYDKFPPFFHYIEKISENVNTASIVNWTPINTHTLSSCTDFSPTAEIDDSLVFEQAKDLLINSDPISADVIFLHFDELDAAGHNYGFSPFVPEYINTLTTIDSYVNGLFDIIENKRLNGEDWICFIVSDHGGVGTGHGDSENPKVNQTIFFANHPTLNFKNNHVSNQTDLSATVLDFIGVSNDEFNCNTDGISIIE